MEVLQKAAQMFRERERELLEFTQKHGHVRPPQGIQVGGSTMFAIGGSIYKQAREGKYTFLDAIHDHALEFFGLPMLEAEEAKPLHERHQALQWMYTFVEQHNRALAEGASPGRSQTGAGAAWYRFAHDLFTIRDNSTLEAALKRRLMDPEKFQGARYELWVASLSVAAGYTLQFEDEADPSKKHPEFVGTDMFSTARIAVEAKSRRRRGAYGFRGGKEVKDVEADVRGLLLDAFTKRTEHPLYVFIDANLPGADSETRARWLQQIRQTMLDLEAEGYADPSEGNAVFVTNDPSHYLLNDQIGQPFDELWLNHYVAATPRVPHPDTDVVDRFLKAHKQRVAPPRDFPRS